MRRAWKTLREAIEQRGINGKKNLRDKGISPDANSFGREGSNERLKICRVRGILPL